MRKLREVLADNPTAAGGILDRLVHNAHRAEMRRFDEQETWRHATELTLAGASVC
jgi:hypothetical protein